MIEKSSLTSMTPKVKLNLIHCYRYMNYISRHMEEKFIFQKMEIPFRQMHSWDYSGPYHGYDGFAIFARDMDMTINNPCWKELEAPWLKKPDAA